jgi:type I restriction enzyme S subunit
MLGKLPADWGISRLKFEVEYVTSGSRGWADYYSGDGALFVRIGNLTRNSIDLDWTDVQHVRLPDGVEGVRARVRPGDLLISITAYLGSVAVAPADIDETYVSQHVALARPHCERSTAEWLGYAVLSSVGRTYFELQAYGGTKIQLSLDDIREMPVPVPPLAVQRRRLSLLKTQLQQLSDLSTHAMTHIERLREYRASLITASVTGQLAHVA